MKNKFLFKYFLISLGFLLVFFSFFSEAEAQAGGGVRGVYQRDTTTYGTYVENIDFPIFHNVLYNRTGQFDDALVTWRGQIKADAAGSYNFRVDVRSQEYTTLYISETEFWADIGDQAISVDLSPGWHSFWMQAYVPDLPVGFEESQIQLYWQPPGESEAIIPESHLDPNHWADDIIVIPDINKPRERLGYKAAGVGARVPGGASSSVIPNPTIEVSNLPGPILRDEGFMVYAYSTDTTFRVRNNISGVTRNVVGTQASDMTGNPVNVIYTKLPEDVIPSSGDLSLTFTNIDYTRTDGIAIIVPYVDPDPNRPLGRISLRIDGRHFYREPGPVFVYPVGDDLLINRDLRPVFIFGDGETERLAPGRYRPNYLVMLSGIGTPPAITDRLENYPGHRILLPENGPINASQSSTWYPNYGREGSEFDVISSNYMANEWSGAINTGGGHIDPQTIPDDHTWVAFQYVSDYVSFDGVSDASPNTPESGFVIGGGIFAIRSLLPEPSVSPTPTPTPEAPSDLSASTPECLQVLLNWQDNSSTEDGFTVERRVLGSAIWSELATVGDNVSTYRDESVISGRTYEYRVKAFNTTGDSDYSNIVSATPFPCPDFVLTGPSEVNATAVKGEASFETPKIKIKVVPLAGFDSNVSLSLQSVNPVFPGGALGNFSDPLLKADEYSIGSDFWLIGYGNIESGTYVVTIRGEGGGLVRAYSFNLIIDVQDPGFKEI